MIGQALSCHKAPDFSHILIQNLEHSAGTTLIHTVQTNKKLNMKEKQDEMEGARNTKLKDKKENW